MVETAQIATLLSVAYTVFADILSFFGIGSSISGDDVTRCPYEVLGLSNVKETCTIDDVNKARRKVSNGIYFKMYIVRCCVKGVCIVFGVHDMHIIFRSFNTFISNQPNSLYIYS